MNWSINCCWTQAVDIVLACVDACIRIVKSPFHPKSVFSDRLRIWQDESQLNFNILLVFFDLLCCHNISLVVAWTDETSLVEKHCLDVVVITESAAVQIVKLVEVEACLNQWHCLIVEITHPWNNELKYCTLEISWRIIFDIPQPLKCNSETSPLVHSDLCCFEFIYSSGPYFVRVRQHFHVARPRVLIYCIIKLFIMRRCHADQYEHAH